jgi:hypothetical protein
MSNLLKEYIELTLNESKTSDAFEHSVAAAINKFADRGISAVRPAADTALPDVQVTVDGIGTSFVEVKMNHTDNLANPRVFFDGVQWATTYKTPVAAYTVNLLNSSKQAKKWLLTLSKFSKIRKPKVPTTLGGLKDPSAVPLHVMIDFVESLGNRYIATETGVDIGALVTEHYTIGKSAPANYMQAADDFYLIGEEDPLRLRTVAKDIPVLAGLGDFKVRVATRSTFYEVQAEVKIKHLSPANSPYSTLTGSSKINPFELLAKKMKNRPRRK